MMTIQQAVNELAMHTYRIGSQIDLHRPTGFYRIFKTADGIFSQCDTGKRLHPMQREVPQFANVGK